MKIRQWLGYNEDASQYLLRAGELRVLNNLQARRPGMLIARKGLAKIYGKYDNEGIYGLYRRATVLGSPSDFLWLQKVLARKELPVEQLLAGDSLWEYIWQVMRVEGNQSRVIDTQPADDITNFCVAEDRHGRMFIFYGHENRPRLYRPFDLANVCTQMGIRAPKAAPAVVPSGSGYFIENVDVAFGGGAYYAPPELTLSGGSPEKPAKLKSIVQAGNVVGVDIVDGGVNYQTPPNISASADKIGTGFRAKGVISSSSRTIEGFRPGKNHTSMTGVEPTSTQTYGATNGTENNSIMYRGDAIAATTKVTSVVQVSLATATCTVNTSGVNVITITNGGYGYSSSSPPAVTFSAPTGTGNAATGTAVVNNAGAVTSITLVSNGSGYGTTAPTITIAPPTPGETRVFLQSVSGVAVGQFITCNPSVSPFQTGGSDWITGTNAVKVKEVDTGSNSIIIQPYWNGYASSADIQYELTFWSADQVALARADYNPATRRFSATIPVRSTSQTGSGAYATLEFSPTPLGYALNKNSTSSIAVTRANWNKYPYTEEKQTTYKDILYEEYWEGSDFNKQDSAENAKYIGLQASGERYVRGFSGTVGKKRADVYWPDYTAISVWFCTGTYSSNIGQWTRADVTVSTVTTGTGASAVTSKVLKFRLRPSKASKTIQSLGGSAIATQYADFDKYPDAVAPEISLTLRESPDSWTTTDDQCQPTQLKEAASDRQQWWSPSTNVARPIVDLIPFGSEVTDQTYLDSVSITDPGRGWQKDSVFAFRLYRGNPYDQYTDYNTSVVEESVDRGHAAYTTSTRYIEYKFTATTPDLLTPHGPPAVLLTPCQITIPGDGFRSGDQGSIRLLCRERSQPTTITMASKSPKWTAEVLDTLSGANTGSITSINILDPGRNYFAPPSIEVRGGGTGYGLSVSPRVVDGRIVSVQILDPGLSYTAAPELFTQARRAELTPVMRPALRGKYKCAYRYVDMSETVVATLTATLGDSATTLNLSNTTDVKADMVLEAPQLPYFAKVKSVNGTQVEVNQQITGLAAGTTITVKVRDLTKPIAYSDLSPIADVDAGPNDARTHSSQITWSIPSASPQRRVDKVELWRTSADQSLVYYRVEAYGVPKQNGVSIVGTDTLTDEQLFDPDRPHYAAMPIVLPNGNVNAYRFGIPRFDMSVGVAFQDRLWLGVSTSGEGVNTLYYSEFDEFESFPDVNELPIQNNQKSTDVLTALVPFGSMLLAMQHTHTYGVTFNTDPSIDGVIQMLTHRGCLHQRCWDIHENILYAADESGIYSLTRAGEVQDISLPLRDYFVSEQIDFSKRDTFFLQTDPRTHILRFFCSLKSNTEDTPTLALCYDLMAKAWWTESYPNSFISACTGRPGAARINTILLGGVDGNLYEIDGDSDHANNSLTDCFVGTEGIGYREAPVITVPNCKGAVVKGVVSEGRLVDVIIQSAGWDATWGVQLIAQDGSSLTTEDGIDIKCMEYDAIQLDVAPPPDGGTTAVAYANFSVTPTIKRQSTVAIGEDYVRLTPARLTAFEPDATTSLATEDGATILWFSVADEGDIILQPPPVEVGMEAIGNYIPLNAFVTRIDRNNVHLAHPDGTPVSMLFGAARTNQAGTPTDWLETGGTEMEVTFYKPYRTHIPFRAVTGFMQMVNEDNMKKGESLIDRSVSVVYTPTDGDKTIEVIERFNGRDEMRPNMFRRDRGGAGGFIHRQDSASTVLNISKNASHLGFATGVATARFANRVYTDMTGEDQHLQVELYGRPEQASPWERENFWNPDDSINAPQPFVLHNLTVEGVVEDAQ